MSELDCLHGHTPLTLPAHSCGCSVSCTSPNTNLTSHSFYKYCTNRGHNGWSVKWKDVQISTNWDEIMAMYKVNMLYEINIKYILPLSPSISTPWLLLKKEMFMRSCWLNRRSRTVLILSTVRIFPLKYPLHIFFPKYCPGPWMPSFLHRKIC